MTTIIHTMTLVYYDGPQVFEGRDKIGGSYIAVMIEPVDENDRYLVAGVEPERLALFRQGTLDLRSLLVQGASEGWFQASLAGGLDQPLILEPQTKSLESFSYLPAADFFLHDHPATSGALHEARERNNLVLKVSVDPPEAMTEHRIRAGTLAGLLTSVQSLVKYSYGAALRGLDPEIRRNISQEDAYLLDVVVPAATGSFSVVLEAAMPPNIFGGNELFRAMEQIDQLFTNVSNPHETLSIVKEHPGHLAGAFLRLLQFVVQNECGFHYAWAEPMFAESRMRSVSVHQAGPLVDALTEVTNLGAETTVIIGALKKADVDSGAWRLAANDREYSGKIKAGGPSLAGLELESSYRFTCLEEIEETQGGREQRALYLTAHEPC